MNKLPPPTTTSLTTRQILHDPAKDADEAVVSTGAIDYDKLQSVTINLLRFPMALMVVFIHMNPSVVNLGDADFPILSGKGIFNITGIIFSHVLSGVAVPVFFLISGYLFFVNFRKWSLAGYKSKLKSRTKTLILPYFLWNAVPFLLAVSLMVLVSILKGLPVDNTITFIRDHSWHIFYDTYEWGTERVNWLGYKLRSTGPYDLPLWFLRDLIIITVLTPVIYYGLRIFKIWLLVLLLIAYISRIWILVPGFGITSVFFFTVGAHFALNDINIVKLAHRCRVLITSAFLILFCFTVYYDGMSTVVGQNIFPIFICFGVLFAFYIGSLCVLRFNIRPNKYLVSSCFFIYALHGANLPVIGTVLSASKTMISRVTTLESNLGELLIYLITPFVAVVICIFTLKLAKYISPKIAILFSGNRM